MSATEILKKAPVRKEGNSNVSWLLESCQIDQKTGEEYYQGNCHDYSAFFTALARATGIPARTVYALRFQDIWIGSEDSGPPVKWIGERLLTPMGVGGHGWAEIYLSNYGWIPVDTQQGTFGKSDNRHFIISKGRGIKIGPNTPERQIEGYGTNFILLHEGRADYLGVGIFNIVKIHYAAIQGLNYLEPSIHVAARVGGLGEVKAFLENGVDVNTRDPDGYTALQWAFWENHRETVKFLLAKGTDVNVKDNEGGTPLHGAAADGHKEIVELLIAGGADLNARDKWLWTTLHYACWKNHRETVEFLLAKGADLNAREEEDMTPLAVAEEEGYTEIVELLRKHGAKE